MKVTAENCPPKVVLSTPKSPPRNEDIDKALKAIGRANRRKDIDGKVTSLVRAHAEQVFIHAADLNQSRANHAARNMIRFDLLPKRCDVAKLKELVKHNDELTRYVTALDERMSKSIERLEPEEVLRLDSNLFTRRLLRTQGKLEALERRQAEPDIQKIKNHKPTAEARSQYATWRRAASPARQNVPPDGGAGKRLDTLSAKPGATNIADLPHPVVPPSAGAVPALPLHGVAPLHITGPQADAAAPHGTGVALHDSLASNLRLSRNLADTMPASTQDRPQKGGATPASSSQRTLAVALDLHGCQADPEPPFAPHTDLVAAPPTTNADYKKDGRNFHHLGKRSPVLLSEEQRFELATEAFVRLMNMRIGEGQTRLFKHMPDLIHRLFSVPASRQDEVEKLLEQIREGLRGGGGHLTPTAQKLLVWMAIVWDDSCLKLDDPAKVQMRERDGQFEVLERDANGQENWRRARTGKLDLAYTTSLIGSWFKNPKALRFDKAALQNIGVSGPVYRSRDGRVEFATGAALRMGKRRLRSLDVNHLLHLSYLDSLRREVHGRRAMKPITLAIDLETLSPTPLDLGNLTELVWGETHGNTALELYVLHAVGIIRIKSAEGWQAIRRAIADARFRHLDSLLAMHIEHGPNASGRTFVLLGNTLAGPMGNDLIELQVRAFLRDNMGIDLPELQSANNAYFDAYWKLNQDKGLAGHFEMPADRAVPPAIQQTGRLRSLQQMHQLMNSDDEQVRREARLLLIKYAKSYYKDDRLQLCRVADDGRTLLTGGRVNQETSRALAAQINADGFRVRTNLSATVQAGDINAWFRNAVQTRDAHAYLAATQYAASAERGGMRAVGNPLAAYIGRYDASPFFPGTALDRGIDRNVSGQSNRIDAYWHLHSTFRPNLVKWLFEPFEAYVETVRPEVSLAPSYAAGAGARLFWRDGLAERDIAIFDQLVANCLYEVPHDATPDKLHRFADYILRMPHAQLLARFGNSDCPERDLLVSLKKNVVTSLTGVRNELHAWDRMHCVKTMTDQQLVGAALAQLDALPTTQEAIEALSRQDLVELLFSGPIAQLFNYAGMSVDLAQSAQRDYMQTRFALNSHAGSEPQHRQFSRTFFGF